ncbi:ALKL2 protein, partial [Polypterus senegalus]
MSRPKSPFILGLVLIICTAGHCKETTGPMEHKLLNLIMNSVSQVKSTPTQDGTSAGPFLKSQTFTVPSKDLPERKSFTDRKVEIFPRDLRSKDKFLKHLTGPLYFSPKCSKQFHRIYHNTRDCNMPAYYKRCARLLTRLAVSPMCMDG